MGRAIGNRIGRDHRGVVFSELIGALAHLGLARALLWKVKMPKRILPTKDFFTLWKNADPNLPLLTQAKIDYGKLQ